MWALVQILKKKYRSLDELLVATEMIILCLDFDHVLLAYLVYLRLCIKLCLDGNRREELRDHIQLCREKSYQLIINVDPVKNTVINSCRRPLALPVPIVTNPVIGTSSEWITTKRHRSSNLSQSSNLIQDPVDLSHPQPSPPLSHSETIPFPPVPESDATSEAMLNNAEQIRLNGYRLLLRLLYGAELSTTLCPPSLLTELISLYRQYG